MPPSRGGRALLGVEPYFDEPFYVGFDVGGYELGLLPDGDPADGALTYWGVDDVAAAFDAALAQGAIGARAGRRRRAAAS